MVTDGVGRSRVRKWLRRVVAALAALVLVAVLYSLVAPLVYRAHLQRVLPDEAEAQRAARSASWDRTLDERVSQVAARTGASQEPAYVARYRTCYVDHNDAGWIVEDYVYRCRVGDAALLELPTGASAGSLEEHADRVIGPGVARLEEDELAGSVMSAIVAYAVADARSARVLDSERGSRELDPTKRYLLVTSGEEYVRHVIGCRPGVSLFCSDPLG